jgi:hypothetical protein
MVNILRSGLLFIFLERPLKNISLDGEQIGGARNIQSEDGRKVSNDYRVNVMRFDNHHPSDEELLLCIDDELSRRRRAAIDAHLSACWNCRARVSEIQSAIKNFVQWHRMSDGHLPPSEAPASC